MNRRLRFRFLSGLTLLLILSPLSASAHAGHDNAPGESGDSTSGGLIVITAEAKKNLGLLVQEAEVKTLAKTMTLIGQIEAIPSRSSAVTSRISGRVTGIFVTEGERVKKGQSLVEVESRQPGEPPPHVQYASSIEGTVTDRHAVLGDTVEPDKHLFEIVDLNEVYAEGRIYEGQIPWIKIGQEARVVVESYPEKIFTGTIELLGGALDPESRTLRVWIRIPNEKGILRPNMRATLNIVTGKADSVIAVPKSAVLGESGQFFVFVQSDTNNLAFERRTVITGISDDQLIEIVEGVFPSDKVVTTGNYQLQYVTTKVPMKNGGEHEHDTASPTSVATRWPSLWPMILSFLAGAFVVFVISLLRRAPKKLNS